MGKKINHPNSYITGERNCLKRFYCIFTYFGSSMTLFSAIYFCQIDEIGPLISHIFRITNHRSLFFWKHRFIFKSLFDGHRSIDYRFALSICPPLLMPANFYETILPVDLSKFMDKPDLLRSVTKLIISKVLSELDKTHNVTFLSNVFVTASKSKILCFSLYFLKTYCIFISHHGSLIFC